MITPEKIKVYDSFAGDEDGLAIMGKQYQKDLFDGNNDWYYIKNFYQDIHLMNNKLASSDYVNYALKQMRKMCDTEAYSVLIDKIKQH